MKKYLTRKNIIISISVIALIIIGAIVFAFATKTPSVPITSEEPAKPIPSNTPASTPIPTLSPTLTRTPTPTPEPPDNFSIAPSALGDITISPLKASTLGVESDSAFLIQTENNAILSEEELRTALSVKSGEGFTLKQLQEDKYELNFINPLERNQIYNLIYSPPEKQPMSYAFQTTDVFRITTTTPAHGTHNIPNNSGIEITFNQSLAHDLEPVFEIHPAVPGRFLDRERNGNTYIFAPGPEKLENNTRYTVTIKGTAESVTGETLSEDYVFHFYTEWGINERDNFRVTGDAYETFLPWDEVFVELNVAEELFKETFQVEIYDLETPENFINFGNIETPSDNFKLIETMERELYVVNPEERWSRYCYILLEKPLPEGYYLIQTSVEHNNQTLTTQKFIQVSPLSVYSLSVAGETCYWVHDATDGKPATGAVIISGEMITKTDRDGLAIINTIRERGVITTVDYAKYPRFVYLNTTYDPRNIPIREKFQSYMYTDRQCYKPTDTIDVYGAVNPRAGYKLTSEDELILKIGDIYEFPLNLDQYGVFNLRIPVTNMYGYMEIKVELNGKYLMSNYIRFLDYTNYSYILSAETDRTAYFLNDTLEATLFATTVVDAPVSGLQLRSHTFKEDAIITTDNNGVGTGKLKITDSFYSYRWEPSWQTVGFNTINESESSQSVRVPIVVAPSDIMLEDKIEGDAITFSSYAVDIKKIEAFCAENPPHSYLTKDMYQGEPTDVDFTISITKHVTTRTVKNESYDFINKRSITTYDYKTTEIPFRTIKTATVNGRVTISDLPVSDDRFIRYSAKLTFTDRAGRVKSYSIRLPQNASEYYSYYQPQESSIKHFKLSTDKEAGSKSFSLNETAQIFVENSSNDWYWDDSDNQPVTFGRMLTIAVRDKIIKTTAGNATGTPFTFTEDYINNGVIFGAYFDGKYVYPVSYPMTVYYDYQERNLNIEMDFDQEQYKPGDEVNVKVQVKDNKDQPKKTLVCISVVDETSILDGGNHAEFLRSYYQSTNMYYYDLDYFQYASYRQHNFGGGEGGAEMGDSGEDGFDMRKDFTDNPVFMLFETDDNGFADVDFKLVDTITSWRVTALGITRDGYAGDVKDNIKSSLPFYIDLVVTNEFLVGDSIGALVKVYGQEYKLNHSEVNYTFAVIDSDGKEIFTGKETSTGYVEVDAEKMDAGEYTLRVTAAMGTLKDGMEMPIKVVEHPHKFPMVSRQQLSDGQPHLNDLHHINLPVEVTMTNGDIWPIMKIMYSCMDYRSYRTDYKAATAYGRYFIRDMRGRRHNDADYAEEIRAELANLDGIPELIYEKTEFEYTARFAAAFPEFINKPRLLRYIKREMENAKENELKQAAGFLALAAMGEPVLLEINSRIDSLKNLPNQSPMSETYKDYMTILYYAAALCSLGDDAGALELIKQYKRTANEPFNRTERETVDTLLLFINTTIDPEAAYLYLKRKEVDNQYVSDVCEKINFLKKISLSAKTTSEVRYTLNDKEETAKLVNYDRVTLTLSKEQFDNLDLLSLSGTTDVAIRFYSNGQGLPEAEKQINISKKVEQKSELYRVSLNVEVPLGAPSGTYTVYDRLQSNMRFVPGRGRNENTERQLVEMYFYYCSCYEHCNKRNFTVSYDAMQVFEAESLLSAAYVSNGNVENHLWGKTE